jgi:hypothetical protein
MKLLLVLGSDDNYKAISQSTEPMGFELIRYRHVLKAMDNIDEIDPSAIIISARDFPRHWKILVQFVRNERSKETCPIVILKGTNFNTEETSKAFFLGVNGIIPDALDNQEDIGLLHTILGTATLDTDHRNFFVEPWHRIGLLIANLFGKSIFTADVKTISTRGLSFSIGNSTPAKAVKLEKELNECSLRAGNAILSPVCRVTGTGKQISLEFISFPPSEREILDYYLRELHSQGSIMETTAG